MIAWFFKQKGQVCSQNCAITLSVYRLTGMLESLTKNKQFDVISLFYIVNIHSLACYRVTVENKLLYVIVLTKCCDILCKH